VGGGAGQRRTTSRRERDLEETVRGRTDLSKGGYKKEKCASSRASKKTRGEKRDGVIILGSSEKKPGKETKCVQEVMGTGGCWGADHANQINSGLKNLQRREGPTCSLGAQYTPKGVNVSFNHPEFGGTI